MSRDDNGPDDVAEDRLRAAVESIGDHARTVNLTRAERLGEALAAIAAGSREESARQEAAEIAHQLVGSAGTFGFLGPSQLAGTLERYFIEADLDDPVGLAAAQDQVRRLRQELTAEPDYQPEDDRDATS